MGNKLYEETSIQAIANTLRSKLDTSDTYKVGEMANAMNPLTLPTGKISITENGTNIDVSQYDKADVNVVRGSAFLTPLYFDYIDGYVQTGVFYRNAGETNNRNDIYYVEQGKRYKLTFGRTVGNRARVMLTDVNVVETPGTGTIARGTALSDSISPSDHWDMYFTAGMTGYVIVTKANNSTDGVPTFLICMSDLND